LIEKRKKTEPTKEKGSEGYEQTEFRQDAAIRVEEEVIFVQSYKLRARDLDLEHTLDAWSPGDHRVQVWSQSSHLSRSRSDLRIKSLQTDGHSRRTPRHCGPISSRNELKIMTSTHQSLLTKRTAAGAPHWCNTIGFLMSGRLR